MKPCYSLALALLLPVQVLAADVQLSVNPLKNLLGLGEHVEVDLLGQYLGEGNLLGGAVSLSFDPAVLQVVNVTLAAPQDIAGTGGTVDNLLGTISGIGFASFAGVTGAFTLATVEFQGVGAGTSELNLVDANDLIYAWVNDAPPFGESVNFAGTPASITVAVPEPESWAMLLAGLGLVGVVTRRRG